MKVSSFLKRAAVVAVGVVLFFAAGGARAATYYVSTGGDDGNAGTSRDAPVKNVSTALAKCTNAGDEVVILASASTYPITAVLQLTSGVTVRSETGDPGDVVLRSNGSVRVFELSAAAALVSGVTVENGYSGSGPGAGIQISGAGGTVSNCVVRGCKVGGYNYGGGGIGITSKTTGALVTHCVISNCLEDGSCRASDYVAGGGALAMEAGDVRNCLFVRNKRATATGVAGCRYGTVRIRGGTLANCTVANNSAGSCAGVWAQGGKVINCLIAGNACTGEADVNYPVYAGSASCFSNCVSDGAAPINAFCATVQSPFMNPDADDWRIAPATVMVDGGARMDWMTGATDFAGNARIRGSAPDVGAYEIDSAAFGAHLHLSAYSGLTPFAVEATVTVTNVGNAGVTCAWDWGSGTFGPDGSSLTASHTFDTYGTYPVVVRVTDVQSGLTYTTEPHNVIVSPKTHYVSKASGVVPTSPYITPGTAAPNIATALGVAAEGSEIVVASGTYAITAAIAVNKNVTVRSETGKPEDVILHSDGGNHRVIEIDAASALIHGLTVENVEYSGEYHSIGGGIYFQGLGGTVSNCVIRNCKTKSFNEGGGGVGIRNTATQALLTHCIISNCQENGASRADYPEGGGALYMKAGTARNCLFVRNVRATATGLAASRYGTVRISGGVLESCTIADNSAGSCAGVWAQGGTIVNCVIAGNACTGEGSTDAEKRQLAVCAGSASYFTNCVADADAVINSFCYTVKSPFVDGANGDWSLAPGTDAVDKGAPFGWMTGATDFAGNARIRGKAPDIGAYEIDPAAFGASLSISGDAGLVPYVVVGTVTVANAGDKGVSCSWDWDGDGTWDYTGSELQRSHEYTDYGTCRLIVRVTDIASGTSYTTKPKTISLYPKTHYVSKASGIVPTSPYATWATAAPDVATALGVAYDGAEIVVSNDTYTITKAIDVLKDVTIRGVTGRPEDVVLHSDRQDHRVMTIASAHARVESLTVENAYYTGGYNHIGAGIYMYGMGGTVSNCIVRGCKKVGYSNGGGGIGIASGSTGSLVTHCVLSNNTEQGNNHSSYPSCGSAIAMYSGTMRNCLVVKNYRADSPTTAGFLYGTVRATGGAQIENCTIADNEAGRCAGIWASDSATKIVNCLIANNKTLVDVGVPEYPVYAGTASCFENCVSDGAEPINATCRTATDPFVNAAGGDWRLDPGVTAAVDKGTKFDWMDGATDFYGNPRVRGKGDDPQPDIGAHEVDPDAMSVRLQLAASQGFKPAKAVATVSVTGGGTKGFTYGWDWDGDGSFEEETETPTAEHTYQSYGTKSIAAQVTDNETQQTVKTATLQYAVYPKTTYVGWGEGITPTAPYDSRETAASNIQTAVNAAVDGSEIVILPGVYTNAAAVVIERAIWLHGETGRPEDVILHAKAAGTRGLAMGNVGSFVDGLTVENAEYAGELYEMGAGIYLYNSGGTVSNCVVRNCTKTGHNDGGGGIGIASSAAGALVTHCVISNCQENGADHSSYSSGGGAICMKAGTVRNCLLAHNVRTTKSLYFRYGTVRMTDGLLENCTLADNAAGSCAGVWATGGKAVNCIIVGNRCTDATELEANPGYPVWAGTESAFTNCLADLETKINDTCLIGTADATYRNFAAGDFRLPKTSPAVNTGAPLPWMTGATDLLGKPRIFGKAPDIGCYECQLGGFTLIVR